MLAEAAKDATEPFEDIGHSEDARADLAKMQIGVLSDPVRACAGSPANRRRTSRAPAALRRRPRASRPADRTLLAPDHSPLVLILAVTGVAAYFVYTYFMK